MSKMGAQAAYSQRYPAGGSEEREEARMVVGGGYAVLTTRGEIEAKIQRPESQGLNPKPVTLFVFRC
jgi:hypothetical protein